MTIIVSMKRNGTPRIDKITHPFVLAWVPKKSSLLQIYYAKTH